MEDAMDGDATREVFQCIRECVSDSQWNDIVRIMQETYAAGVEVLSVADVIAIVESVVLSGDDAVTVEDLKGLTRGQ